MMMHDFAKRTTFAALLSLFFILGGCSDEQLESEPPTCNAGERLNPISNRCEPTRSENTPPQNDTGVTFDTSTPSDTDAPSDTGTASDTHEHIDTEPTQDDDASSQDDTADTNLPEQDSGPTDIGNHDITCLDIAEGHIDPSIICEFYAHTPNKLFLVDPFRKSLKEIMDLPGTAYDIDMHTNGTLYLVADSKLLSLAPDTTTWKTEGDILVGNPNGLCLNNEGNVFITSYAELYSFDFASNRLIGPIGRKDSLKPYSSSGDCVITKGNDLYMSSNSNQIHDDLVQINGDTGVPHKIGTIGFNGVYGLTAAWGRLYGLTGTGQVIEINTQTGRGTLIHTFSGKVWNGAASTPQR